MYGRQVLLAKFRCSALTRAPLDSGSCFGVGILQILWILALYLSWEHYRACQPAKQHFCPCFLSNSLFYSHDNLRQSAVQSWCGKLLLLRLLTVQKLQSLSGLVKGGFHIILPQRQRRGGKLLPHNMFMNELWSCKLYMGIISIIHTDYLKLWCTTVRKMAAWVLGCVKQNKQCIWHVRKYFIFIPL